MCKKLGVEGWKKEQKYLILDANKAEPKLFCFANESRRSAQINTQSLWSYLGSSQLTDGPLSTAECVHTTSSTPLDTWGMLY